MERETAGSVCLFSVLVSALERSQAELMEVMDMSRRAAEHQADAMIRQLELEVKELRRRASALSELAQSDDHIHCVKVSSGLSSTIYYHKVNKMTSMSFNLPSTPDIPHPRQPSTCQRLVCGVGEL